MSQFNRDGFINANLREVSRASFAVIDALQAYSPGAKVAAMSAVFKLYADSIGLSVPEAMEIVNNIMHHGEGKRPEFRAIAAYLQHEME